MISKGAIVQSVTTQKVDPGPSRANDESALVARLRARDRRAFEYVYKTYHARLSRFLMNVLRRPHLVEEVLNDTMMVVWEKIDGFHGASRLSTWMFGIGYRQALAALRKLDEPVEDDRSETLASNDLTPEQRSGAIRSQHALAAAINQLSAPHRAVINLTYYQEFGYREIAEIMDCPVDTIKTRMFHARRHLKQSLSGDLADWL
jgi:RNA polymerase sigma factor (sigma-70 family)